METKTKRKRGVSATQSWRTLTAAFGTFDLILSRNRLYQQIKPSSQSVRADVYSTTPGGLVTTRGIATSEIFSTEAVPFVPKANQASNRAGNQDERYQAGRANSNHGPGPGPGSANLPV